MKLERLCPNDNLVHDCCSCVQWEECANAPREDGSMLAFAVLLMLIIGGFVLTALAIGSVS